MQTSKHSRAASSLRKDRRSKAKDQGQINMSATTARAQQQARRCGASTHRNARAQAINKEYVHLDHAYFKTRTGCKHMEEAPWIHRPRPRAKQHVNQKCRSTTTSKKVWSKPTLQCQSTSYQQRMCPSRPCILQNTHALQAQ